MADLSLEAQLPPAATEALNYLYKRVGKGRVEGPARAGEEHEIVLTRSNGKQVTFYGRTAAEVLAKAKVFVEKLPRSQP